MKDINKIDSILGLIKEIWYRHPDLRLTQLIMNALNINRDPYYIEDETLKKALKKSKKQWRNKI